jgi:glycosyltransferase involved in cell wall biosynthesis
MGDRSVGKFRFKLKQRIPFVPESIKLETNHSYWRNSDLVVVSQGACMDGLDWLERIHEAGKDYVILCQANMECMWPSDPLVERIDQVYSAARAVCFVSAENERLFRIQNGYQGTNTSIVWNPLQGDTPEHPLPWPNQGATCQMAMVGRIEPFAKGQDLMLEVLSMDKWRGRDLTVTIYGKGPWEMTARKIVAQRSLNKIRFGGYAKPQQIWSNSHILALPSRHEGMSLAMLEAMWLGRPVVATAVAGARSEIVDGSNGFLAPAPTVELWDQAMEHAWQSRNQWCDMGLNAAVRIRARMNGNPLQQFTVILEQVAGINDPSSHPVE